MSEPKFTRGPWTAALDDFGDGEGWQFIIEGPRLLAALFDPGADGLRGKNDTEQAKANAGLIAAAPDLYEALELCRVLVCSCTEDDCSRRAIIDIALAKARGEK